MEYYIVTAICGHVGRSCGIEKCFPIEANSAKEAAYKCRKKPRVKHDFKAAIQNVEKVSLENYESQKLINDVDPFFLAKSRRESYLLGMDYDSVFPMEIFLPEHKKKKEPCTDGRESVYGISKKKYVNRYKDHIMEEYNETFRIM